MNKIIEVGDIVRLKSGGPDMTVESMGIGGDVNCLWSTDDHNGVARTSFPAVCLKQMGVEVKPEQPPIDNAHVAPGCEQFSDADIASSKSALAITRDGNTFNFPLPGGGNIAAELTSEQAAILDSGLLAQNPDVFKEVKVTQTDAPIGDSLTRSPV